MFPGLASPHRGGDQQSSTVPAPDSAEARSRPTARDELLDVKDTTSANETGVDFYTIGDLPDVASDDENENAERSEQRDDELSGDDDDDAPTDPAPPGQRIEIWYEPWSEWSAATVVSTRLTSKGDKWLHSIKWDNWSGKHQVVDLSREKYSTRYVATVQ